MGSIYFLLWWFVLFFFGKKCRKEIFLMSIIGLVFAPMVQYMHLIDWWSPVFIHKTFLHIEDLIFGFSIVGISTSLYHVFVNSHEKKYKKLIPSKKYELVMWILGTFLLFGLFFVFRVHSFWTSIIALIFTFTLTIIKRHDLLMPMLLSGIFLTIIATPFYLYALYINPMWINQEWFVESLSGYGFWGIPIEELSWYFFIGLSFSALWEFMNGLVFIKTSKKKV